MFPSGSTGFLQIYLCVYQAGGIWTFSTYIFWSFGTVPSGDDLRFDESDLSSVKMLVVTINYKCVYVNDCKCILSMYMICIYLYMIFHLYPLYHSREDLIPECMIWILLTLLVATAGVCVLWIFNIYLYIYIYYVYVYMNLYVYRCLFIFLYENIYVCICISFNDYIQYIIYL